MYIIKKKEGMNIAKREYSVGMQELTGQVIRVETTVRDDKEQCVIIGLPDASIKESKERILNCLHSLSYDTDIKKITILLSPSDVKKQGASYNAAMLLAVMQALDKNLITIPEKTCFIAARCWMDISRLSTI